MVYRQDIAVLLFYYLGYSRIRNLMLRFKGKSVARFVVFHDVPPETLRGFEASLRFLKRHTNVVSLDDFFSGRLSAERVNVVITFDDGYKSWVTDVLPILKRLELPVTFFISSGFVGLTQKEQSEFMCSKLSLKPTPDSIIGGLAVDDVKKLAEEGFTVGGHTVNHYNLAKIPDEAELRYEIAEDKQRLEKIIGGKVEYFAYPFGALQHPDIDISRLLRESGYKGAVTTKSGFNDLGSTHPYLLHREITYASMSGPVFKARALGNYDAVSFLKRQGKNINMLEQKRQKA